MVCGVLPPDSGRIFFHSTDITESKDWRRARLGIARTFQNLNLVSSLSLAENVAAATLSRVKKRHGLLSMCGLPRALRAEADLWDEACRILEEFDLVEYADRPASELPGPIQRRAEIARVLLARPSLLLLDEPVAGMTLSERADVLETLSRIPESTTVLLVEHDVEFVMKFCGSVTVLDEGTVIASGRPDDVRRDERVIAAYLGA
jgi:branched-chain amino acid transport system ATP-binding protein